mgnify:CR=1 FL=1
MEIIESQNTGEVVLYQPDETMQLDVRLANDTVWLTQAQISELFQKERSGITKHISNIFKEGELEENSNVSFFHIANSDKPVKYYSLDFEKHNKQCREIQKVQLSQAVHDRFLIIDDEVWLLGSSVKDMGHSLCSIIKMSITPDQVLTLLK